MQKTEETALGGMNNVRFVFFCCKPFLECPVREEQVLTEKKGGPTNIATAFALSVILLAPVQIRKTRRRPAGLVRRCAFAQPGPRHFFAFSSNTEEVMFGAVLHDLHDAVAVHLQVLLHRERFLDGDLDDAALLRGDDAVAAALDEGVDGVVAHARRGLAVARVGRAAALDVAQHGHARIHADGVVDALADLHSAAHALGHDDHEVRVAGEAGILDARHDVLLKVDRTLRYKHGRRADGDADVQREEAGVAPHDLDDRARKSTSSKPSLLSIMVLAIALAFGLTMFFPS